MKPPRFEFEPAMQLVPKIIAAVSRNHQVDTKCILGKSRRAEIIWPRHLSMWLALKLGCKVSARLGRLFKRDHSTITYAAQGAQDLIDTYPLAREEAEYWLKRFTAKSKTK